ncbi:MAG: hypothetical protein HYU39_04210 [Thaumarchaeota archaeon]|nr:hypothetical protein [Nitrososphaerota archaeon]
MEHKEYVYPKEIMEAPSDKEVKRVAKKLVELEYGRYAIGPVKKGEKVLIVIPVHQDKKLLDAIVDAIKEKGAGEIDVVSEAKVQGFKTNPNFSADRAWDEFAFFPAWFGYRKFLEDSDASKDMIEKNWSAHHALKEYLEKLPKKYDKLLAGPGGWSHYKAIVAGPYKSLWPFTSYEYARLFAEFPGEVWNLVEDKIKNLMPEVEEVRIRDEEGTDITFTMSEEEAKLWREESQPSNHLFMYPRPPSFPEANGVIAGTSNHFGFFPYAKVYVRHGLVEKIEGGGKFGGMWNDYWDRYRSQQWPEFPSPGYYYIHECALATNPRGFRHIRELFNTPIFMTNDSERNRAGTIHWGFGLQALDLIERQRPFKDKFDNVMKFCKQKDLPYCHSAHIHNYFITYEVRLRDTNQWIKLVDKGWITLFDDPYVRKVASKYGDPEKIFKYDWVPAIPGITYDGNYLKDYAKDPLEWIRKEIDEIIPKQLGIKKKGNLRAETGRSVVPHEHEHDHRP